MDVLRRRSPDWCGSITVRSFCISQTVTRARQNQRTWTLPTGFVTTAASRDTGVWTVLARWRPRLSIHHWFSVTCTVLIASACLHQNTPLNHSWIKLCVKIQIRRTVSSFVMTGEVRTSKMWRSVHHHHHPNPLPPPPTTTQRQPLPPSCVRWLDSCRKCETICRVHGQNRFASMCFIELDKCQIALPQLKRLTRINWSDKLCKRKAGWKHYGKLSLFWNKNKPIIAWKYKHSHNFNRNKTLFCGAIFCLDLKKIEIKVNLFFLALSDWKISLPLDAQNENKKINCMCGKFGNLVKWTGILSSHHCPRAQGCRLCNSRPFSLFSPVEARFARRVGGIADDNLVLLQRHTPPSSPVRLARLPYTRGRCHQRGVPPECVLPTRRRSVHRGSVGSAVKSPRTRVVAHVGRSRWWAERKALQEHFVMLLAYFWSVAYIRARVEIGA